MSGLNLKVDRLIVFLWGPDLQSRKKGIAILVYALAILTIEWCGGSSGCSYSLHKLTHINNTLTNTHTHTHTLTHWPAHAYRFKWSRVMSA